jgi:hypothetical protein
LRPDDTRQGQRLSLETKRGRLADLTAPDFMMNVSCGQIGDWQRTSSQKLPAWETTRRHELSHGDYLNADELQAMMSTASAT